MLPYSTDLQTALNCARSSFLDKRFGHNVRLEPGCPVGEGPVGEGPARPPSPGTHAYTYLLGTCPRWIFWAFSSSCQAIQDPNVP